jgi:regulator-associated protein of mTOR
MSMRLFSQRKSLPFAAQEPYADCSRGTQKHRVKIFNINNGQPVSSFEPYSGFLRDRSAPISATAFHPHRLMIAAAALHDNHVNIFSCHEPKNSTMKTVRLWEGGTVASSRASTFSRDI